MAEVFEQKSTPNYQTLYSFMIYDHYYKTIYNPNDYFKQRGFEHVQSIMGNYTFTANKLNSPKLVSDLYNIIYYLDLTGDKNFDSTKFYTEHFSNLNDESERLSEFIDEYFDGENDEQFNELIHDPIYSFEQKLIAKYVPNFKSMTFTELTEALNGALSSIPMLEPFETDEELIETFNTYGGFVLNEEDDDSIMIVKSYVEI